MPRGQYVRQRTSPSTAEMDGPKAPDITLPASGPVDTEDFGDFEVVRDLQADKKQWSDNMRFMNELVTIRIHDTNDPNAEPRVPVELIGKKSHPVYGNHLPRGIELDVRRYVAEIIARAKPINVKTVKTIDHDGNDTSKIVRSIGVMYPFELVNPKPADLDWLKRIRSEL